MKKGDVQLLMKAMAIQTVMIQLQLVTRFTKDAVKLIREYECANKKITEILEAKS